MQIREENKMKTVVKKVTIEGMDFALVREPEWGADHQYGTVT